MDVLMLKQMAYDELRNRYRLYLQNRDYKTNTIRTVYSDTFYLWKNGSHDMFWRAVEGGDAEAKVLLLDILSKSTTGDPKHLVNSYLSHIRRFRVFLSEDEPDQMTEKQIVSPAQPSKPILFRKKSDLGIPNPSKEQVDNYLAKWDQLKNYRLQEKALDKLFRDLCPQNTDISDILLKVSVLNDFYSTNIFSVNVVAEHIYELDIDARMKEGDPTLVNDIMQNTIGESKRNFYSFASKYCSHHNLLDYPIYDSYVDSVLRYFRYKDGFAIFKNEDLKQYTRFKCILEEFRNFYRLQDYNWKCLDKYLWLLGKEYFPKQYRKKS